MYSREKSTHHTEKMSTEKTELMNCRENAVAKRSKFENTQRTTMKKKIA